MAKARNIGSQKIELQTLLHGDKKREREKEHEREFMFRILTVRMV